MINQAVGIVQVYCSIFAHLSQIGIPFYLLKRKQVDILHKCEFSFYNGTRTERSLQNESKL